MSKQCAGCGQTVLDQMEDCPECEEGVLVPIWEGPEPYCTGCKKFAKDIPGLQDEMNAVFGGTKVHVNHLIAEEEGTFNPENGHFLCMSCYIKKGTPSSRKGWKCP